MQKQRNIYKGILNNENNSILLKHVNIDMEVKQAKECMKGKKVEISLENVDYFHCRENNEVIAKFEKLLNIADTKKKEPDLKPFSLEAAKAGKPVCTRDGHKVRIICFDYYGIPKERPIIALLQYRDSNNELCECIMRYPEDGKYNNYRNVYSGSDLMMLPEKNREMDECVSQR